ncbi:neutral amino acid-binding protein [Thalassoporum mexicanum PCC 7367]|uniref:ABC transporter substrate-binding protein n=1 Tax=Thalassoporum mexicanum TaxID=3457544 RepID=UPI00029FC336|nr:ABC transporter substrate-binding protein [Pseudanabaena sp. PCC 7367]AFY69779.1 neutral amino acid-binding protein [Pseudanabaena sp. PCC 7367]
MNKRSITKFSTSILALATCISVVACQNQTTPTSDAPATDSTAPATDSSSDGGELKMGVLLPATGDLSAIGAPMVNGIDLLVETVNSCGGVLDQPINLIKEDTRTQPSAGAEAMTKLAQVDQVGAVVGAFGSSISTAAIAVAAPAEVLMISPGSTSPVFTERAQNGDFNGYWYRTAPPDTYQAAALAKLAYEQGHRRVATLVINNDYGVGFEQVFVESFKALGGEIINENNPTRYDPQATTFEAEARGAFGDAPDAVAAVLYPETGAPLLKAAYEQGLLDDVQVLLTDGVQTEDFIAATGQTPDGQMILAGALGTVPGADGDSLAEFSATFKEKKQQNVGAFVAHSYDAAALVALAAQAANSGSGPAIKAKIREVANAPGEEVSDVCAALEMLKAGTEINYQGASGNVDLDEYGDVKGSYDVWSVTSEGKIEVIDKVSVD